MEREPIDAQELLEMRAQSAVGAEDFEEGERLAVRGELQQALVRFKNAERALPSAALPIRRECEVLTSLGRHPEAIRTCFLALGMMRTNINLRAAVRALLSGPSGPTTTEVTTALQITYNERRRAGRQWVLSSALCDIAERTGDGFMLQHCAAELVELAPQAPETSRALALLKSRCPPWRLWGGWGLIGAAAVATGARRVRRRRVGQAMTSLTAAAMIGLGGLCGPNSALADGAQARPKPGDWLSSLPLSDNDPEGSVPSEEARNKDPLQFGYWLQDVTLKGELASKHGDHLAAVRYFRALAQAVPDRAISLRMMCDEYELLADHEKAVASCGAALLREGVTQGDYARYVRLVLAKDGSLSAQEAQRLDEIIEHLKSDPSAHPLAEQLQCEVAARTSNKKQLRECTAALVAAEPNAPNTVSYQWALALLEGNLTEANVHLERAKQVGMQAASVEEMSRAVDAATAQRRRTRLFTWGSAALAAVFMLGAWLVAKGRRMTPQRAPS